MSPAACPAPGVDTVAQILIPSLSSKISDDELNSGRPRQVEHIEGFFECGPREVHPWQRAAMPSLETIKASQNYPVVVTPNPMFEEQAINGLMDCSAEVPINSGAMTIDSPMFEGTMEVHLKGLPSSQPRIFEGKKRFFQVMVQGRFKRHVDADGLCMGQEFVKAGNVPPWVGEVVLTAAAKVFSSSTQVDITAQLPYFMNPVLAACQIVNASLPGSEPALAEAQEDMRLFAPELCDKQGLPLTPEKRRKWCDCPSNLSGLQFSPDYIYTFHIWQHVVDFSSYKLSLGGFMNLDLTHALNCQPLQLTVKDTHQKEYMFSMLVWHERLLYGEASKAAAAAAAALTDRLSKWGTGIRSLWNSTSTGGVGRSSGGGK